MLNRKLQSIINKYLIPNKVIVILGARRVGKTILVKSIEKQFQGKVLLLNAEDNLSKEILETRNIASYKRNFEGVELLIIDEAQTIPYIGQILKLIVDEIQGIKIIATGSSAFDLLNKFGEPLTGRSFTFHLYPFSQEELMNKETRIEAKQKLDERLIFGSYPEIEIYSNQSDKRLYLQNLISTYLLKDILVLDGLRGTSKIIDLLKLLAYQLGNEVSPHELGKQLGMSKNTVEKYLNLLQKVFVIFELKAFSKNLRKEVSKNKKWYFYDNGIRNAIISDFTPMEHRKDMGILWENYMLSERTKFNHNNQTETNMFFWRTYDQQEIDLIEENAGKLSAFEFKWSKSKAKIPVAWKNTYPESSFSIVDKTDYPDWIT